MCNSRLLFYTYYYILQICWDGISWKLTSALWGIGYQYYTSSFNKIWTQVPRRFKSCFRCVGDLGCWESMTVVPAGNKTQRLSTVLHSAKTIHHHHHHHRHHHSSLSHWGYPLKMWSQGDFLNIVTWLFPELLAMCGTS